MRQSSNHPRANTCTSNNCTTFTPPSNEVYHYGTTPQRSTGFRGRVDLRTMEAGDFAASVCKLSSARLPPSRKTTRSSQRLTHSGKAGSLIVFSTCSPRPGTKSTWLCTVWDYVLYFFRVCVVLLRRWTRFKLSHGCNISQWHSWLSTRRESDFSVVGCRMHKLYLV